MTVGNGQAQIKVILCAGQHCQDRERCARYRVRGGEFRWASWDIERQALGGPCPQLIEIRQERKRSR